MYDKEPIISIQGWEKEAWKGYKEIAGVLGKAASAGKRTVLCIECYPSVRVDEILAGLSSFLNPSKVFLSDHAALPSDVIHGMIDRYMTDDRVFGYMAPFRMEELFDVQLIRQMHEEIAAITEGLIIVIGVGASVIYEGDLLVYADLTRWEIQQRYRSREFGNWRADNCDEDILRKYKRGFFFEWRVADRLKRSIFAKVDYYLDTNTANEPKLVSGAAYADALRQTVARPFRLVPYFDPGVWGGTWLQEKIGLEAKTHPYAWGFDGVPEENSLFFVFGNIRVETPAINLVFFESKPLLGEAVYARFGAEFPIRFDFLDTMGGQNLSLQVHPSTDYIRGNFGMQYTQDESYYMLDTADDCTVYLGTKENINPEEMLADLEQAQNGGFTFPAEKYINIYPAKKHDHFLIPAGTVHCSGTNGVVLEISATPYIFTFKLWDWDRVGLDGRPRPVHLRHGKQNIVWNRDTRWVEENLINRIEVVAEGQGWREERTGLHEFEFIETRRHWFTATVPHRGNGSVQVLNLVEGDEAVVASPTGAFKPFVVRFAETFIIPAAIEAYTISPTERTKGQKLATIKAFVKH